MSARSTTSILTRPAPTQRGRRNLFLSWVCVDPDALALAGQPGHYVSAQIRWDVRRDGEPLKPLAPVTVCGFAPRRKWRRFERLRDSSIIGNAELDPDSGATKWKPLSGSPDTQFQWVF